MKHIHCLPFVVIPFVRNLGTRSLLNDFDSFIHYRSSKAVMSHNTMARNGTDFDASYRVAWSRHERVLLIISSSLDSHKSAESIAALLAKPPRKSLGPRD